MLMFCISFKKGFFLRIYNKNCLFYITLHSFQKADVNGIQFAYNDLIQKMGYAELNRNLKGTGGFLNNI